MSYDKAVSAAKRMHQASLSSARPQHYHVVSEPDDETGQNTYHTANDYDLDGFYAGSPVVFSTVDM
jgi:hypothetical protein